VSFSFLFCFVVLTLSFPRRRECCWNRFPTELIVCKSKGAIQVHASAAYRAWWQPPSFQTEDSPSPRMNLMMCFPFYQKKNHCFGRSKEEHYAYRSILLGNCIHYGQGGNVWVQKPHKNDNNLPQTPRRQGYTNEGIATGIISKSFLVIKNNQKKFQGFLSEQRGKFYV
jgi:hypothetical protein